MEILTFNDIADFCNMFYELASEGDAVVTAVLFYDNVQRLLRTLLQHDDVTIGHIDLCNEDFGYKNEFYVTIDHDLMLDIRPAFTDGKYQTTVTDAIFFEGDANSRIAIDNEGCLQFELVFQDDSDYTDETFCDALEEAIKYIASTWID